MTEDAWKPWFKAWLAPAAWFAVSAVALAAQTAVLPALTDLPGSPRLPGKFVWADLVTDDVMAARKFYGPLFGWTFRQAGDYLIAANDDWPVAGLFQRPRPKDRPEAKPRWFGYLSVPSVERAERRVTEAGGKVLVAARHFPKRGEQAVFSDPEGALFGVLKSSSGDPPDFLAEPGDWVGGYSDDVDIVVAPPPRPSHPIAPPPAFGPRPMPLPSIPARPMPRGR
jgi:hypothetical protein